MYIYLIFNEKSVCVNALILSIIYKATPEQIRMIMGVDVFDQSGVE